MAMKMTLPRETTDMKTFLALVLSFCFCATAVAGVFDVMEMPFDQLARDFNAKKTNQVEMKINDKKLKATRYESDKDSGDIIGFYQYQAEQKKYTILHNDGLDKMASFFINSGRKAPVYDYDYVFYIDDRKNGYLIAAENDPDKSEVVKVEIDGISNMDKFKGYEDGLAHFPGAKKVLSIEMLSSGRTVNFSNFYKANYSGNAMDDFYRSFFKREGWKVLYEKEEKDSASYVVEKGTRQYLLNIYSSGGEQWLTIIG